MNSSTELGDGGDDLARQRRQRDARLLDQRVAGFPGLTLADVVAEALAARDAYGDLLDVPSYLAIEGHDWPTIEAVVGYLHRYNAPSARQPSPLRPR